MKKTNTLKKKILGISDTTPTLVFFCILLITGAACSRSDCINWDRLYQHYASEEDSVQREAVRFLEQNLPEHYSTLISVKDPLTDARLDLHGNSSLDTISFLRLLNNHGTIDRQLVKDERILTEERILEEINLSYAAWTNSPWYSETPKWVFLNALLPYKVDLEYPDRWRSEISSALAESKNKWINERKTPYPEKKKVFIADYIYQVIRPLQGETYTYDDQTDALTQFPSFSEIKMLRKGECYMGSTAATYFMRAAGIPTSVDIIPYWGSMNGSHAFDVHWDPVEQMMVKEYFFNIPVTKVFRKTFKSTHFWTDSLRFMDNKDDFLLPFLRNNHTEDVTHEHVLTYDIAQRLQSQDASKIAYICVHWYGDWMPVSWSRIQNRQATFKNMGANVLYRIAIPDKNNRLRFASPMFYLHSSGNLQYPGRHENQKHEMLHARRINHGKMSIVKQGKLYALFGVNDDGGEELIQSQICAQDSSLTFDNVPKKDFYILRESGASQDLSRYFSYNGDDQDWLMKVDTIRYRERTGWPY